MSSAVPAAPTATGDGFELKAGSFTLPTLRLLATDMEALASGLSEKVVQAPEFFHNMPVVIDLKVLQESGAEVDFALLVGLLRGYGMIPFAVRGGNAAQHRMAEAMELAVLSDGGFRARRTAPAPQAVPVAAPRVRMITQPVRSGQRVYAPRGDLIVLAPVSSGAEVLADGNIHVYGSLRGRALAGVRGDRDARIFCRDLQAELVSVAGHYHVSDQFDDAVRGKPVQVFLVDRKLFVQPF